MGFFTEEKEELTPKLLETPEQTSAKKLLSSYWEKYGLDQFGDTTISAPGEAYPGQLSAATPSSYGQIDPILSSYLSQGTNPLMNASQEQIMKTLQGGYDPYTSEYYKSFKEGVNKDTAEAQASLRQKAQAGGMYESLGRILSEADVEGTGQDRLNTQLATMQQQERTNMLNVLPQAMGLGEYQEAAPTRKLSAISTYGGVPSAYEQSTLDRLYEEYKRQKAGEKEPLSLAQSFLSGYNPSYAYSAYQTEPSTLSTALGYGKDIASIVSSLWPKATKKAS